MSYFNIYDPTYAHERYKQKRLLCHRPIKFETMCAFLAEFVEVVKKFKFSPDAFVGETKRNQSFFKDEMVCTTTLYKYIDLNLLEVKNIDLVRKIFIKKRKKASKATNKRLYGESIENHSDAVKSREEFGHFEIDTVIAKKSGSESVLLTLTERKTRYEIIKVINGKDTDSVTYAINQIISEYGENIFQSITADNGSEFANLTTVLNGKTKVYYTHPYVSSKRGTNENHNGIIRRFLAKGESIDSIDKRTLESIADIMNELPRKILNYQRPREAFQQECLLRCSS
ncbi:MAG TPA: IS30 family transposase [Enterococcus columbae]|nr:IS30 family transposase [Enterococcus columbae]